MKNHSNQSVFIRKKGVTLLLKLKKAMKQDWRMFRTTYWVIKVTLEQCSAEQMKQKDRKLGKAKQNQS